MNPCKCGCDRDEHSFYVGDEQCLPHEATHSFCPYCSACDEFQDEDGVR